MAGTNCVGVAEQGRRDERGRANRRQRGWIVYVDRGAGHDEWPGRSPVVVADDGPKRSIRAGLSSVEPGGTMIIKSGQYAEGLRIAGRNIKVRIKGRVRLQGGASDQGSLVPEAGSSASGGYDMTGASTNRQGRGSN